MCGIFYKYIRVYGMGVGGEQGAEGACGFHVFMLMIFYSGK